MTAKTFEWKKGEFAVGRRVRARGRLTKGVIKVLHTNGLVGVQWIDGHKWNPNSSMAVKREELILLRPKPKPEPRKAREFEVSLSETGHIGIIKFCDIKPGERIHVREVLPNTVQVSREDIQKAWDIQGNTPHEVSILFKGVCKALGFKEES